MDQLCDSFDIANTDIPQTNNGRIIIPKLEISVCCSGIADEQGVIDTRCCHWVSWKYGQPFELWNPSAILSRAETCGLYIEGSIEQHLIEMTKRPENQDLDYPYNMWYNGSKWSCGCLNLRPARSQKRDVVDIKITPIHDRDIIREINEWLGADIWMVFTRDPTTHYTIKVYYDSLQCYSLGNTDDVENDNRTRLMDDISPLLADMDAGLEVCFIFGCRKFIEGIMRRVDKNYDATNTDQKSYITVEQEYWAPVKCEYSECPGHND